MATEVPPPLKGWPRQPDLNVPLARVYLIIDPSVPLNELSMPRATIITRDTTDTLGMAYLLQRVYQYLLCSEPAIVDPVELIRRSVLYAMAELGELLNATPWRWHRRYPDNATIDVPNLIEEVGDCVVFLMNACAAAGVSELELRLGLRKVQEKNYARLAEGVNRYG